MTQGASIRMRLRPRRIKLATRDFGFGSALATLGFIGCMVAGCAGPAKPPAAAIEPIRVSKALGLGDPARQASTRLVVQGLDADEAGQIQRARGSYERALQVDPTNPYAYLALARHALDVGEPNDAIDFIEQAAALFEAEGLRQPEVGVHLIGLRAQAFEVAGRTEESELYFETAAEMAPHIWQDGSLSATELR